MGQIHDADTGYLFQPNGVLDGDKVKFTSISMPDGESSSIGSLSSPNVRRSTSAKAERPKLEPIATVEVPFVKSASFHSPAPEGTLIPLMTP